jgi:hypothetical protein
MVANTFRLWATEKLITWPNRLHVLLIVMVTPVVIIDAFANRFTWLGLLLATVLIGSLVLRVWRWDRRHVDGPAAPATR